MRSSVAFEVVLGCSRARGLRHAWRRARTPGVQSPVGLKGHVEASLGHLAWERTRLYAAGGTARARASDSGAHIAALCDVAGVAEAAHQLRPSLPGATDVPAEFGRLIGEPVAGQ